MEFKLAIHVQALRILISCLLLSLGASNSVSILADSCNSARNEFEKLCFRIKGIVCSVCFPLVGCVMYACSDYSLSVSFFLEF